MLAFDGSRIEGMQYCSAWQLSGIPDTLNAPWNYIAVFYDDLVSSGNDILHTTTTLSGYTVFVVQWTDLTFWDPSGTHELAPTVQAFLFPTGDIGLRYVNNLLSNRQRGSANSNIGIENSAATLGVQILHKQNLDGVRAYMITRSSSVPGTHIHIRHNPRLFDLF